MDPVTIGGYSGAVMVLFGFACRSRMTPMQYSLLNCLGSFLLAMHAAFNFMVPQLSLNGLWCFISLRKLWRHRQKSSCREQSGRTSAGLAPGPPPTPPPASTTSPASCATPSPVRDARMPFSPTATTSHT
tara:strand:- start:22 stop:411 length:390 start_codon:yes stop_codon:yes gene_type:complete